MGHAKPGQVVMGRPYYGGTYDSYDDNLGKFIGPDDEHYGRWYRLVGVTVYKESPDGVKAEAAYDGFIAGNFLRLATEEERHEFFTSSE